MSKLGENSKLCGWGRSRIHSADGTCWHEEIWRWENMVFRFWLPNHMGGTKKWFLYFYDNFRQNVKFGDDRKLIVEGKESFWIQINGYVQTITLVSFDHDLKNNLLSVGKLQQKRLRIIIEEDNSKVWHKYHKILIMHSSMYKNIIFMVFLTIKELQEYLESNFLQVYNDDRSDLWYMRLTPGVIWEYKLLFRRKWSMD